MSQSHSGQVSSAKVWTRTRQNPPAFHTKIPLPPHRNRLAHCGWQRQDYETNQPQVRAENRRCQGAWVLSLLEKGTTGISKYSGNASLTSLAGFLSLMSSFTKLDFSLVYPLPSMWEWKQKLASLAHKNPPKQAQVHFSKVTAFKSLSVDVNTTSRVMLFTSSQTDG